MATRWLRRARAGGWALLAALAGVAGPARADEGGGGHYQPGYAGYTFGTLPAEPGLYFSNFQRFYTGTRRGADVPQVYLTDAAGMARTRLLGFERVELEPDESRSVTIKADPRLLATFDSAAGQWRIEAGTHKVALGPNASEHTLVAEANLDGRLYGR